MSTDSFFPLSPRFVGRGWGEGGRRKSQSFRHRFFGATPHPIPLPEAGRGGGKGAERGSDG
jgi:hypothetical protein